MDQPKVSVIVPWWKGTKWWKTLQVTLAEQKLENFEVLIVNNGPPYASDLNRDSEDRRWRFINLPENCGIAKALNVGLELAQGEYVTFMDQDDWLSKYCLMDLAHALDENEEWIAAYGWMKLHWNCEVPEYLRDKIEDEDGKKVSYSRWGYWNAKALRFNNPLGHPIMVRRGFAPRYQAEFGLATDLMWLSDLAREGHVGTVSKVLYHWNLHGKNPSFLQMDAQRERVGRIASTIRGEILAEPKIWMTTGGEGEIPQNYDCVVALDQAAEVRSNAWARAGHGAVVSASQVPNEGKENWDPPQWYDVGRMVLQRYFQEEAALYEREAERCHFTPGSALDLDFSGKPLVSGVH